MKIIGLKAVMIAVLLAAFSTAALAQANGVYSHKEAGIQFTVPEGWEVEMDGASLIVGPANGQVSFMFYVVESDTMEAAAGAIDDYLTKAVTEKEVTEETREIEINGLATFAASGKGKIEGTPVEYTVAIVFGKKPLMIFGVSETAVSEKYSKQIKELLASIGPAE